MLFRNKIVFTKSWHDMMSYNARYMVLEKSHSFANFPSLTLSTWRQQIVQIKYNFHFQWLVWSSKSITVCVWGRKHMSLHPVVSCSIKLGFLITNNKCVHQWMLQIFKVQSISAITLFIIILLVSQLNEFSLSIS